jgi:hypothetical protein
MMAGEADEEEELPPWMRDTQVPVPTGPVMTAADEAAPPAPAVEEEEEELPSWLVGAEAEKTLPIAPEPVAQTPAPPPEPARPSTDEMPIPAWLGAPTAEPVDAGLDAFLKAAVPASVGAEEKAAAQAAAPPPMVEAPPPAPVAPPPIVPTQSTAPPPPAGSGLQGARSAMTSGHVDVSLSLYEEMVASGQGLNDVITDLSDYIRGKRVNPRAFRIIGDALMAQGKLQEALDYYRRALDQF